MSGLDIRNSWTPLHLDHILKVEAAVGVYELRRNGETLRIDYAGAKSPFGLRGALIDELNDQAEGIEFRAEVVSTYLSRWSELMSWYRTRTGAFPAGNGDRVPKIGIVGGRAK